MSKKKNTAEEKNLIKRYLLWCYKTTKEELERVDRKFTQLVVDDFILKKFEGDQDIKDAVTRKEYHKHVEGFREYMIKKEGDAFSQKFSDKQKEALNPHYLYLKNRLAAVEKAICHFFDKKELAAIQSLYQVEMTKRILEAREHS